MRPKFVFSLLLLAFLAVAATVLVKRQFSPGSLNPETTAPPAVAATVAPAPALPKLLPAPPPAPAAVKPPTPEERAAAIKVEEDQLVTWSMNNDPQSLSNILNDLASPEKEIRMAAIEAAKQFDSTNAIPALKAAAASSADTEEQIAMLEAADFISLPDAVFTPKGDSPAPALTPQQAQAQAQSKAQAAARIQAYMQSHHPGQVQNSQSAPPANSPGNSGSSPTGN